MSKKKIIAGIMGSAILISGDSSISTVVKNISEMEEKEKKSQLKKTKENKKSIRNKREIEAF